MVGDRRAAPLRRWSWRSASGVARAAFYGVRLALAMLLAILVNPSLVEEQRVAAARRRRRRRRRVRRASSIGNRREASEKALAALTERLRHEHDLDVRVVRAGAPQPGGVADDGTKLFTALNRALADVPRQRLAGVVMITDGEVHDVPPPTRLRASRRAAARAAVRPARTRRIAASSSSKRRASVWSARKCS